MENDFSQNEGEKKGSLAALWITLLVVVLVAGLTFGFYHLFGMAREHFVSAGKKAADDGAFDRAIAQYSEAITIDPKSAAAHEGRGLAYAKVGFYRPAIADFNKAIELDPKFAKAYDERGACHTRMGEADLAMADFDKAIETDPKLASAYADRGLAWNEKQAFDKAIADFNKAVELDPSLTEAYSDRGLIYTNRGEYDKALADFDEAIRREPKSSLSFTNRGYALSLRGDYDKAIADFEQAIALAPNSPGACNDYAWLLATCPEAKYRNGKKAVEYAMRACIASNWLSAPVIDTLAAAYAEEGDFEQAKEWENKYLSAGHLSAKDAEEGRSRLALYEQGQAYREK